MQNAKFDMQKIANQLNVNLKEAHKIVQSMLFKQGWKWVSGHTAVYNVDTKYLFIREDQGITCSNNSPIFEGSEDQEYTVKVNYAFEEVVEEDLIELDGKRYSRAEFEDLVLQAFSSLLTAK